MSALKRPRIGCVAERRMSAAAMIRSPRKERLGAFGTCQSQSSLAIEEACAIATNESPTGPDSSRESSFACWVAGCFVGLQPGRRNSGESEPQMAHQQRGDEYQRTLLVQGAHYILGPFGEGSDLRRWGLKLSARGGKNAKKRAVVAVARKLAVLLHRLWVSGEVYEPLRNSQKAMTAAA